MTVPYYSYALDDKKKLKIAWANFVIDIYSTLGNVTFSGNEVQGTLLNLMSPQFNNYVLPTEQTGKVLEKTGTSTVAWSDASATDGDVEPGTIEFTIATTAESGWLLMNDGTIGDASSAATARANADTSALFTILWNANSNAICPVSGGRGASAAADFAAHKTLRLPQVLDKSIGAAGAGSGLTNRTLCDSVGNDIETITINNLPSHTHTIYGHHQSDGEPTDRIVIRYADPTSLGTVTLSNDTSYAAYDDAGTSPYGTDLDIRQPYTYLNAMIKL